MNVQELIASLQKVEDKSKIITISHGHTKYDGPYVTTLNALRVDEFKNTVDIVNNIKSTRRNSNEIR